MLALHVVSDMSTVALRPCTLDYCTNILGPDDFSADTDSWTEGWSCVNHMWLTSWTGPPGRSRPRAHRRRRRRTLFSPSFHLKGAFAFARAPLQKRALSLVARESEANGLCAVIRRLSFEEPTKCVREKRPKRRGFFSEDSEFCMPQIELSAISRVRDRSGSFFIRTSALRNGCDKCKVALPQLVTAKRGKIASLQRTEGFCR